MTKRKAKVEHPTINPKLLRSEEELLPIDPGRCQSLRPNPDWSFMRFGPVPKHVRCSNKPVWIAVKDNAGMSLCDECKAVAEKQIRGVLFQHLAKEL